MISYSAVRTTDFLTENILLSESSRSLMPVEIEGGGRIDR